MSKQSHRIASRQAAVSKERKRKKKSKASQKDILSVDTASIQSLESTAVSPETLSTDQEAMPQATTTTTVVQPTPVVKQVDPKYQYVLRDLKKAAIIAGAMVVILIVLAFVLA